MKIAITTLLIVFYTGCETSQKEINAWKEEIKETEKAFSEMARNRGIPEAFEYYADPEGVIRRSKKIIKGKDSIRTWYNNDTRPGDTLSWTPTFIDVSASGDMGYTYGDYRFTYLDSLGNQKESTGIFHTVWKRQPNGEWRYVWD
ncbi:YybH family protein [Ekhidna sp.]|uniref:YybH family protein n=1 Tax=Ekhidna sp. TaxID=2608089 RepID=UPI003C7DE521